MPPFKHQSTTPKASGFYIRDWRGTDILPVSDRALSLDRWDMWPSQEERTKYGPGLWFVAPDWNDASYQHLPWREPTESELKYFFSLSELRDSFHIVTAEAPHGREMLPLL